MDKMYPQEEMKLFKAIDSFFDMPGYRVIDVPIWTQSSENSPVRKRTGETEAKCFDGPFLLKKLAELELTVCGGTVNSIFSGQKINDLDFYCKNINKLQEAQDFLYMFFPTWLGCSENAATMQRTDHTGKKFTIQLIRAFHGPIETIFSSFDFTITQGGYDFERGRFILGDRFLPDIARRKLIYLGGSRYPICAMYRTKKYQKRGYDVPGATIMHIALCIVQLQLNNYADLKKQLMGIDTLYLQDLFEKRDLSTPIDYGEFINRAFEAIDGVAYQAED